MQYLGTVTPVIGPPKWDLRIMLSVRARELPDGGLRYRERFAAGAGRERRIGIVAIARELSIALRRYIDGYRRAVTGCLTMPELGRDGSWNLQQDETGA